MNRSLIKQRDRQQFKPFLAQLAVLGCKQNHDDYEWLRGNYYDRLVKYIDKWFSYDSDHNGLPVWNSADAAGTDNQWSRAGALDSFEIEGVDLACYLVRELRAMSVIATHLSLKADSADLQPAWRSVGRDSSTSLSGTRSRACTSTAMRRRASAYT